jgi:hypothetical protein
VNQDDEALDEITDGRTIFLNGLPYAVAYWKIIDGNLCEVFGYLHPSRKGKFSLWHTVKAWKHILPFLPKDKDIVVEVENKNVGTIAFCGINGFVKIGENDNRHYLKLRR